MSLTRGGCSPIEAVEMARWARVLVLCAFVMGASACATFRPLPTPAASEPPYARLRPGDEVVLVLRDGREVQIEVARIEGDALRSAEGVEYARHEILRVSIRRISPARTALLVGGIVAGAYAALFLAVALLWN